MNNAAFTTRTFPANLAARMAAADMNTAQLAVQCKLPEKTIHIALSEDSGELAFTDMEAIAAGLAIPLHELLAGPTGTATL